MSPLQIGKKTINSRTLLKAGALVLLLSTLLWDPLLNNPAEESQRWITKHYPVLLTPPQLQAMYKSLIEGYWVPQTGVFLSFPRTSDARLIQQASTYDQGVSGLLLLKLGDKKKVLQILKFYETAWDAASQRSGPRRGKKGFSNFYNAYYRVEGVEKTMHVGPNAWIGLLAARYHRQTADPAAFKLALEIARWIIHQVPHVNGVVAMGEIPWNSTPWDKIYSTENNLSTYAFLNDLLKCTDLSVSDRQEVLDEKNRIGDWLVHHAYDVKTGKVLRGFHWQGPDVIGAIDSYSWYLSALRPDYLYAQGVPTDHLLHVATHEFVVRVGGLRGVDAVDQGMASATYRDDVFVRKTKDRIFLRPAKDHHRLLWYEGQGQYIVTLQDMARDAATRAFSRPEPERQRLLAESTRWLQLAQNLTQWMDRASFELPFGPVYPCASPGRFYLWGWPAPAPMKDHPADAIAPLAWRMLSGMGYEPLSDTQINPAFNSVVQIDSLSFRNPGTDLLYGASEEMVVRAWQLYEGKHYSHAQRQARVTIALWEKDAKKLEKLKEKEVGTFLPYEQGNMTQFQRIHDYWALNDVAAAYFIIGKIADERKDYTKALQAFSILLKNYHLAQMWDKRGWFWDPVETLQMDYASADEKHYGALMNILYPEKRHWYSSIFHRAST